MPQPKGSNGPSVRGQLELALCDVDDGAMQIAGALEDLRRAQNRLQAAYLHAARGYRRVVNVNDGPKVAIPAHLEARLVAA